MAGKQYDEGLTSAAFGQAPMGEQPQGQKAGEMFPGNGRMVIDRSNPNPSDRELRMDALYNTIEDRDLMKRDAGARMEKAVDARAKIQSDARSMGPVNKSGYDRDGLG